MIDNGSGYRLGRRDMLRLADPDSLFFFRSSLFSFSETAELLRDKPVRAPAVSYALAA